MIPSAIVDHKLWEALLGLGILVISVIVAKLFARLVVPLLSHWTSKTETQLDDFLLRAIRAPLQVFIVVQGAGIALTALTATNDFQAYINEAWKAVSMAVIVWGLQRVASAFLTWYGVEIASRTQSDLDDHLLPIVRRTVNFAITALGMLIVLSELGIQINPLLAGLGIGGLAIALALQPTLANFFSGTYVLSDGSIRTGDYVEVQGGPSGTIKDVGWRITKLVSGDNNLITIPNSKLADSIITNYSQPDPPVNIVIPCGVSYECDLRDVERVSLEVMKELQQRMPEADKTFAPVVRFASFGESNVNFNLVMRGANMGGTFLIRHELIKSVHVRFAKEGLEMNYPVRKLVLPANGAGKMKAVLDRHPSTPRAFDTDADGSGNDA